MRAAAGLAVLGSLFPFAFLVGIALPAWWLGYLAMLSRPLAAAPGGHEWYPTGRLLLWIAVIGAVLISATMLGLGSDAASLQTALREALAKGFDLEDASQSDELTRLVDMLVVVMPAAAAAAATLVGTLNLWLAGRVVRLSGRLSRPWPNLLHADALSPSRRRCRSRCRVLVSAGHARPGAAPWRAAYDGSCCSALPSSMRLPLGSLGAR